jgi:hypothetical protein
MNTSIMVRGIAAAFLAGSAAMAVAQDSGEVLCAPPGLTILTDNAGDVDGTGIFPVAVPLDYADIVSVQVAQPPQADGVVRLVFTINLDGSLPPVLPPYSGWYTSFKAPNGTLYGVRLTTNDTGTPSYISYVVGESNGGQTDGRFMAAGSQRPADDGSASGNVITITVKGLDIGIRNPGDQLKQFNAGSLQGLAPGGTGVLGIVMDGAPDDLSRRGEITTRGNEQCTAAKGAFEKFGGGAFGFALLLPLLALAGLRRRA